MAQVRAARSPDAVPLAALKHETFLESFVEGGFCIPYPSDDLAAFVAKSYAPAVVAAPSSSFARDRTTSSNDSVGARGRIFSAIQKRRQSTVR